MLRLGDFSSEEIDPMDLKQASLYISQILHNPITLGYPDPTNAFSDLGFSIQAIGHTTARVLLVINHPPALELLSKFIWIYEQIGYNLIVDENTIVREYMPRYSTNGENEIITEANNIEVA